MEKQQREKRRREEKRREEKRREKKRSAGQKKGFVTATSLSFVPCLAWTTATSKLIDLRRDSEEEGERERCDAFK